MQSLLQTRPESLDDLTIQVALIRPGPVSGGAVHPYVKHRRALRADPGFEPPYDHPLLADCLRETLGVVVFQEQVLEVAMALAGFTPGQAEELRRAMSRKRSREAMVALWRDFRDGAREQGVDDETTRTVFRKLIGFSNFGFPRPIRRPSPCWPTRAPGCGSATAEFLASLMNAQPMGFYPPATLVRDAQRRGVRVLPPCIARSDAICTVEDGAVRVGSATCARCARTPPPAWSPSGAPAAFRDIADLAARADLRREQLAQLVRAGACDAWIARAGRCSGSSASWRGRALGQAASSSRSRSQPGRPSLPELGRFERTVTDYETTGLSTGWHLVTLVRPGLPHGVLTAAELRETPDGARVSVAGLVVARQRPATAGASSSCSWRTRPGWSTASSARRSTTATGQWCARPAGAGPRASGAARAEHERPAHLPRADRPAGRGRRHRRPRRDSARPRRRAGDGQASAAAGASHRPPPRGDWRRGVRRPPPPPRPRIAPTLRGLRAYAATAAGCGYRHLCANDHLFFPGPGSTAPPPWPR